MANAISKTAGGAATLTLNATNQITFNAGANLTSTTGALNVALNAGAGGISNLRNVTIVLRRLLMVSSPYVRPEPLAFVDGGRINTNQNPFLPDANSNHLFGAGVGFNLFLRDGFRIRANWAWKIGPQPAQSAPDSRPRGWIQLGKDFQ